MKLIKAAIDIFVNSTGTTINVYDKTSHLQIIEIELTPEQLSQALSRLSHTECTASVFDLDKINKTHEHKTMTFEIPKELSSRKHTEQLHEIALGKVEDGWCPDKYYGTQTSFSTSNGICYANVIVRRWVDIS